MLPDVHPRSIMALAVVLLNGKRLWIPAWDYAIQGHLARVGTRRDDEGVGQAVWRHGGRVVGFFPHHPLWVIMLAARPPPRLRRVPALPLRVTPHCLQPWGRRRKKGRKPWLDHLLKISSLLTTGSEISMGRRPSLMDRSRCTRYFTI
jgi:hypothetical protein